MLSGVASLINHSGRWYLLAETLPFLDWGGDIAFSLPSKLPCRGDLRSRKGSSPVVDQSKHGLVSESPGYSKLDSGGLSHHLIWKVGKGTFQGLERETL